MIGVSERDHAEKAYQIKESLIHEAERCKKNNLNTLVFAHRQGDPDALCAASALSSLLETWLRKRNISPRTTIIAPQGVSQLGARVSKRLNISYEERIAEQDILAADLIIAVDVGDLNLLEPYDQIVRQSPAMKIQIDHHGGEIEERNPPFNLRIVQKQATSTCEIIALSVPPEDLGKEISESLLVGIMFDSQHLGIATARTLEAALILVRNGAQIEIAKEALKSKPDRSEVIARLKSAQRLQVIELGKYFFVKTEVSSFHASVARVLIDIGADVGVAYGEMEKEARLSVRSSGQFHRETGIDLGEILEKIAREEKLTGGGHPTAASISGVIETAELTRVLESEVRNALPKT